MYDASHTSDIKAIFEVTEKKVKRKKGDRMLEIRASLEMAIL